MANSISFHRLPGGSPLFLDYVENFDRVFPFYQHDYRQPAREWLNLKNDQFRKSVDRHDLVTGLLSDAERWNCSKQTRKNILALQDPETLAVVTGQQVGLFGGPLYTYYKALTAVLWAQTIQRETGRTTIPVFWMETSDHDFFEINHIRLLNTEGEEILLSLTHPPEQKRRIVGSITLNGEIEKIVQRLWTLLPASSYRGALLEMLQSCYHPGATVGDAFARLFAHLFGEDGLVLFDAENAQCKRTALPLIDRILDSSLKLNELLSESTEAVHLAGYPPQIQPQDDRLQFFVKIEQVRVPVDHQGNLILEDGSTEIAGITELKRRVANNPGLFLPKVSLRPILQDYLFPTIAYVAGPAEIAYLSQLKTIYQFLEVEMPVVLPRLSLTLIEAKIKKILDKYHFTPEQLRQGAAQLVNETLEKDPSNDLVGLFARARQKWEEVSQDLALNLITIDPTLENPVHKTSERWLQGLEVLEEKARAAVRQKHETVVAQIRKAHLNLLPGGQLQERRFNLQYYWARYGRSLSQRLRAQAQLNLSRHQLINLEEND